MKERYTTARAPGAWPLLGHAVPLLRSPLSFLTTLPGHGDMVHIRIGPLKAVVVCDPELTHQVLLKDRMFDKGGPVMDRAEPLMGKGLATCPHRDHRRQRRLAQPAFHPTRMPGYAQIMAREIAAVTESWHEGQTIDVVREMMTLSGRVIIATLFANPHSAALLREVLDDAIVVATGFQKHLLMPRILGKIPTTGNRRYHHAHSRLRDTIGSIIADYRAGGVDHGDLLSMLLTAHEDSAQQHSDHGLSDSELYDVVISFFFAGMETTASVLSWAVHLLAQHPHIEQQLTAEVDTVLTSHTVSSTDLKKLELTGRVVTETLRLYPPAWVFTRTTATDTHFNGLHLPAGATVIYSSYLIHHRPDLYPDPERFDPDRWNDIHATRPSRGTFVPFGAGARKCIGDTFGMIEATIALATITAQWRLEPIPGKQIRPTAGLILNPKGLQMRAAARNPVHTSDGAAPR